MMNDTREYFKNNGYVVLTDALSKQQCAELTQHMFNLYEQGKLVKDDQCPLSDAVYGDPMMDQVLETLARPIGNHIGKKLLPTYAYARIYRPGEILKKHKDRPSCQYSATLTLGFDSASIWPIYFENGDREIPVQLSVGELAVYCGCDLVHWRPPFKGNWHVQVFLHYVDEDGPYADHAYDGRGSLSHKKGEKIPTPELKKKTPAGTLTQEQNSVPIKSPVYNSVYIPTKDDTLPGFFPIDSLNLPELMFTPEECDAIINLSQDLYPSTASVGGGNEGHVRKEIRSADIYNIEIEPRNKWVFDKLAKCIYVANAVHFDYEVSAVQHGMQLIHYYDNNGVAGHYDWHVDAGSGSVATRKISFTVQLSDPNKYKGCDLEVMDHAGLVTGAREKGAVNMFPSYMPHRVTPIESGERWALVIWVHGSRRFR